MDVAARLETVEAENDMLRERIAQLEALLGIRALAPLELCLTGQETKVFGVLMARDMATKEAVMAALYGAKSDSEQATEKVVDVFVCKMRKKLRRFNINIETQWGQGYYFKPETKKQIIAMMPRQARAA